MKYEVLEDRIRKSSYAIRDLAKMIGISNSSFTRKRSGITDFRLSEMTMLKSVLSFDGSLDELFS